MYVCIMHPSVYFDMFGDDETSYPNVASLAQGGSESGYQAASMFYKRDYAGASIYMSSNVDLFTAAGASNGASNINVYPTYVIGRDAFGVVNEGTMEMYVNTGPDKNDPLNQRTVL